MKKVFLIFAIFLFLSGNLWAARIVNSVTVDGASSTSVAAGATISTVVNVSTTGNGSNGRWRSTGWRIAGSSGPLTCEDHANHQSSSGNFSETFNIAAPAIDGVYNLYLVAYRNDSCSQGASSEFVLSSSVVVGSGGAICETFRDYFSTESYSRQDGTAYWASNWVETGDNGAVSNGDIEIDSNRLQLEGDGSGGGHSAFSGDPSIEREADLSSYATATLTFDYSESGNWESNDDIDIYISSDGGSNWTLIHRFSNDQGSSTQQFSADISAYISNNTRIAFVENANSSSEIFYFDNVQIEACGAGVPTVDALTTSDTTPILTGTFNSSGSAGGFTVTVNSVTYTLGSSTELTNNGDDWTLDLSAVTPLVIGIYEVEATSDDGAGNTQTDTTSNELSITALVCNATYRDEFSSVSFGNNDGDSNFFGNWDEFEGSSLTVPEASPNPSAGHVIVSGGRLVMNNYSSESANAPGVERQLDLSMFTSATFSFDFVTSGNVDSDDSLLVQASDNGGSSWTLLENITGIGNTTGSKSYDLTPYISSNTKIRLRFNTTINSGSCCYGASPETISFDNINIDATGSCPSVDHYSISHSGTGITCAVETVIVTAHNADHSIYAVTSDTSIMVTTSPVVDAITSSPVTITNGNSSATFAITETTVTASIDINVTDGTSTETTGSADTNPLSVDYDDQKLAFVDSLFQFVTDTNVPPATTIGTHIGGKPSSTAPNGHNLYLRAVRTDDTSGVAVCVSALDAGAHDINMGYQCIDTNNCSVNELSVTNNLTYNSGAATTIAHNDGATTTNTFPATLDFDVAGYAPLSFLYNNVGQVTLFAGDYLANGGTIYGDASNAFVVRPFGLTLDFGDSGDGDGDAYDMREDDWNNGGLDGSNNNNSYAADVSGTAFNRAGVNFLTEITAVLWQSADDTDNNGVPDSNSNLYNNSVATLYGQESAAVSLSTNASTGFQISQMLDAPAGGVSGTFSGVATAGGVLTSFSSGKGVATLNWNEVGIIDIQMVVIDYLGDSSYSSSYLTENIGRFYPNHFDLTNPVLIDRSDEGCLAPSIFTYMDENLQLSYDISAMNSAGTVTQNYTTTSGFAKLDNTQLNIATIEVTSLAEMTSRLNITTGLLDFINGEAGVVVDHIDTLYFERLATGAADGVFEVSFGVAPVDSDNVALNAIDLDLDVSNDSTNDHRLIDTTFIYYGRMNVSNAFGSELVPLSISIRADYYDGLTFTFIANTVDNCTSYDAPVEVDLVAATYTLPLASSDLALTGAGTLTGGVSSFSIHDDLDPALGPGVTGDIIYDLVVPSYLMFDWDLAVAGDENPSAKASFGIYSGDSKQIYFRQIYQ